MSQVHVMIATPAAADQLERLFARIDQLIDAMAMSDEPFEADVRALVLAVRSGVYVPPHLDDRKVEPAGEAFCEGR